MHKVKKRPIKQQPSAWSWFGRRRTTAAVAAAPKTEQQRNTHPKEKLCSAGARRRHSIRSSGLCLPSAGAAFVPQSRMCLSHFFRSPLEDAAPFNGTFLPLWLMFVSCRRGGALVFSTALHFIINSFAFFICFFLCEFVCSFVLLSLLWRLLQDRFLQTIAREGGGSPFYPGSRAEQKLFIMHSFLCVAWYVHACEFVLWGWRVCFCCVVCTVSLIKWDAPLSVRLGGIFAVILKILELCAANPGPKEG